MFCERKTKERTKRSNKGRWKSNSSATYHQFNLYLKHRSVQGGQIWLLGTGRPELPHSRRIPNLPQLTHWVHPSLSVNKVTSLPGIALRKGISHKQTIVTNNLDHGHVRKIPYTCGHMPAHTLEVT